MGFVRKTPQFTISLRVGMGVMPVFFRLGGGTGIDSPIFGGNGGLTSVCTKIAYDKNKFIAFSGIEIGQK